MGRDVVDSSDYSDTNEAVVNKTYKCTYSGCNASFSKNSRLVFHVRKHTGERPYVCNEPDCTKSYTNSSHLRRHKKVFHEKDDQTIVCDFEGCGIVLTNKYNLKRHYNRKHNRERYQFLCSQCEQGFHRKKQLQQHNYIHTGEAAFKCDQCNFSFVASRDLNKHKKSHKTYNCECGLQFGRWTLLTTHRKICRKISHICKICNKSFTQLGNLKSHVLTHTDQSSRQVYTCPHENCYRFYFYKKNLIYHINKTHRNKSTNLRLKCSYKNCNSVLKTKQSLRQHLLRHSNPIKDKTRKARCDHGKPKKSMAALLTGIELPTQIDRAIIDGAEIETLNDINGEQNKNNEIATDLNEENSSQQIQNDFDDMLLEQCEITLTNIQNEISKL